MKRYTTKDLANPKMRLAIEFKGDLERLKAVLKEVFPNDMFEARGNGKLPSQLLEELNETNLNFHESLNICQEYLNKIAQLKEEKERLIAERDELKKLIENIFRNSWVGIEYKGGYKEILTKYQKQTDL